MIILVFRHIDDFVNVSRDNETVQQLILRLTADDPDTHRYAIWDKIAEGIGNLQALRLITIVDSRIDGRRRSTTMGYRCSASFC
jgi:hypothetical protein